LVDGGALGAQRALVEWAPWVALEVHDLAVDGVDEGRAADGAVGTDAGDGLGVLDPELGGLRQCRRQVGAQPGQPAKGRAGRRCRRHAEEIAPRDFHCLIRGTTKRQAPCRCVAHAELQTLYRPAIDSLTWHGRAARASITRGSPSFDTSCGASSGVERRLPAPRAWSRSSTRCCYSSRGSKAGGG